MDNNVLASDEFDRIVGDLIDLGFGRGAKLKGRLRFVDFNQGLETERITKEKAKILAKICLKPIRLAYDFAANTTRDRFERAVRHLADEGFTDFSTYILYNYNDKPSDFYRRLDHCRELNERLGVQIYSFPMRYLPTDSTDRSHVGKHWNRKMISGLQKITNVTHGSVMPGSDFFKRAYGRSFDEFEAICAMPDYLILHRGRTDDINEDSIAAAEWRESFLRLTSSQKQEYWKLVDTTPLNVEQISKALQQTRATPIKYLLTVFLTTLQKK